ncbi:MAG: DNA-binding transcriptional LysR family regulator [Enterobacterales bacterium]|jgi:DNA-binding transcriptional LysR family regulator
MNFHQIKYLIALAETNNFSRAAERVHVTQSTLSSAIRKLEEELQIVLFDRTTKGVHITREGEKFLKHARVIFSEMNKISEELGNSHEPDILKIGLLKTLPMNIIAPAVQLYREKYPAVIMEVNDDDDERIRKKLDRELLSTCITTITNDDYTYESELLFEEELMIAISKNNPLSKEKSLDLSILNNTSFIERINCDRWDDMHQKFDQMNINPRSVFWAEGDLPVLSMVGVGMGLSIMPPRPNSDGVVFIPIQGEKVIRRIGLIRKKNNKTSILDDFFNFIKKSNWPNKIEKKVNV